MRALTPCEFCVFQVKKSLSQTDHDVVARLVEKEVGRLQRLMTCPAIVYARRRTSTVAS